MRTWADDFNTYADACHYYGVDTPEQAMEEERYWAEQEELQHQAHVNAFYAARNQAHYDECPF